MSYSTRTADPPANNAPEPTPAGHFDVFPTRSPQRGWALRLAAVKLAPALLIALTGVCSCSRLDRVASGDTLEVALLRNALPEQEGSREDFLARTFSVRGRSFDSYTTDNWKSNFTAFASVLVQKAQDQKLDSASLRGALDLVLKDAGDKIAFLPIGAYHTTLGGKPVWIVTVKWEYPTTAMGPLPLGHIRAFAFDQKTLKQVAFMTCG